MCYGSTVTQSPQLSSSTTPEICRIVLRKRLLLFLKMPKPKPLHFTPISGQYLTMLVSRPEAAGYPARHQDQVLGPRPEGAARRVRGAEGE